ncbi:MAG: ATP phosphoribosyltransferase [Dehalococcoidia bacterium]|nr:ATP phosphoribosyltransferase [Dehalococcoidia bacterium]
MIKLALPAGDLRAPLADLLAGAGLRVEGYGEGSRSYRLAVRGRSASGGVTVRVFREKDIPIQIALGNYDLGVCSIAWVREMQVKFPEQPLVPLFDLKLGPAQIYAGAALSAVTGLPGLASLATVRIASDYPNLAEAFARAARLPAYRIQAVWGAAEAYPPEDADVAVIAAAGEDHLRDHGLTPLFCLLESSAWLIANAGALARKDLGPVLGPLVSGGAANGGAANGGGVLRLPPPLAAAARGPLPAPGRAAVRLAVPDGHQQRHAVEALRAAGLELPGYGESPALRRPPSPLPGVEVKVIRPHDMPQLIATGELDLAITGRDCLNEHLYSFPASPVEEVIDLQRGQYNLSAVVSADLPAGTIDEALDLWRSAGRAAVRIAAEFPATADHYARSRHFWRYQIIPIAGASEGFVPEDADLLIEGTETGKTLAENKLKVIDLLYRSTTCVIARKDSRPGPVLKQLLGALRRAAGAAPGV